jgi:hypothetical protein
MGNYEQLKQAVSDVIKTNGNQEITGAILQNALLSIISTIGVNATFAGIATPTTVPGTPDQNIFYIAGEGTYANFSGITVEIGQLAVLKWNGAWSKQALEIGVGDGNMILDWVIDAATTREQVPSKLRKPGMQISYKNDSGKWVNEQYIGTSITGAEWAKDTNWERAVNQEQISKLDITYIKYYQSTVPSVSEAQKGDIFYRTSDNAWYIKGATTWLVYTPKGILYTHNNTYLYIRNISNNILIPILNINDKEELQQLINEAINASKGTQYSGEAISINLSETKAGIIKENGTVAENAGYYHDVYNVENYKEVTINTTNGTVASHPWAIIWELDKDDNIINIIPAADNTIPLVDYRLILQPFTKKLYVQRGSAVSTVQAKKTLADEVVELVNKTQKIDELSEKVDDLSSSLITYKLVPYLYEETKNGWLINASGNIVKHAAGKVLNKYNISDKKVIKIECNSSPNTNDLWLQFVFKKGEEIIKKGVPSMYPTPYTFEYNNKIGATELYVVAINLEDIKVEADDGKEYNIVDEVAQNVEDYVMQQNIINGWGDSLTYGQGGGGTTYPQVLQDLIDNDEDITEEYKVINCGVQGNTTPGILARQGGVSAFIKEDVIVPPEGQVDCSIRTVSMGENGFDTFGVLYNGDYRSVINPVMINGEYYNLRTGPKIEKLNSGGESITIKAGSNILTYGARLSSKSYINIFYTGQNDGELGGSYNNTKRIEHLKNSMNFANTQKNLFISTVIGRTQEQEYEYQEAFGSAYINLYHEMSTRGVKIAVALGLMNEGTLDTAWNVVDKGGANKNGLLNDSIHWNYIGYTVLAHIIFERLKGLGWLTKKQADIVE